MLGFGRSNSAPYIITEIDSETGRIFARNPFNNEFAGRVAFVATNEKVSSATCDRKEFLGRNGSPARPAALGRTHLAGRDGAGLDSVRRCRFPLNSHRARHVSYFLLGEAESKEAAETLIAQFNHPTVVNESFEGVLPTGTNYWDCRSANSRCGLNTMAESLAAIKTLSCAFGRAPLFINLGAPLDFAINYRT